MNYKKNLYDIKLLDEVSLIYSETKKTVTIIGIKEKKSLTLKLKLYISKKNRTLRVSSLKFPYDHAVRNKKVKALRNTTVTEIKQLLIESSISMHKKLKIIGIGYKANFPETSNRRILLFKLGFSHPIYIRIPNKLTVTFTTKTKFCILGSSYEMVTYFSALVRSKKVPEPYKGKGILYNNEVILIKKGKQI